MTPACWTFSFRLENPSNRLIIIVSLKGNCDTNFLCPCKQNSFSEVISETISTSDKQFKSYGHGTWRSDFIFVSQNAIS